MGSGCRPVLYDYDGDGLTDLFIGNWGSFDSARVENGWLTSCFSSSVSYYRNTGTATAPAFTLQTHNFGNLKSLGFKGLHPTFGDFDGDGLTDMLCGLDDGTLLLVPHQRLQTGTGNLTAHFEGIDVGECSAPQFFDLDGDGNRDLIIGNRRGLLSYYRNVGTNTPEFQKITDTLGGVDMRDFTLSYFGYSVPWFYRNVQHGTVLFCSGEQGEVAYYKDIDGNLDGLFEKVEANLVETIDGVAQEFREGRRVAAAVSDLTGDGRPDLLLGNYAGGVAYFAGALPPAHTSVPAYAHALLRAWPNPARDVVRVEDAVPLQRVSFFDIYGRNILNVNNIQDAKVEINISDFPSGIYLIKTDHAAARVVKW